MAGAAFAAFPDNAGGGREDHVALLSPAAAGFPGADSGFLDMPAMGRRRVRRGFTPSTPEPTSPVSPTVRATESQWATTVVEEAPCAPSTPSGCGVVSGANAGTGTESNIGSAGAGRTLELHAGDEEASIFRRQSWTRAQACLDQAAGTTMRVVESTKEGWRKHSVAVISVLIAVTLVLALACAVSSVQAIRRITPSSPVMRSSRSTGAGLSAAESSTPRVLPVIDVDGSSKVESPKEEVPEDERVDDAVLGHAAHLRKRHKDGHNEDGEAERKGKQHQGHDGHHTSRSGGGADEHKEKEQVEQGKQRHHSRGDAHGHEEDRHHDSHNPAARDDNGKEQHQARFPAAKAAEESVRHRSHHKDSKKQDDKAKEREPECHTAMVGEACFKDVRWAMQKGIYEHPEWYPSLGSHSSFLDFQSFLAKKGNTPCKTPCGPPCLCLFDVDRTLTAQQGLAKSCPGTAEVPGVNDTAFGGGTLVLSALAQGIQGTFCGKCYRGVVAAGDAGGEHSDERGVLMQMLGGAQATAEGTWSGWNSVESLLVVGAVDTQKQNAVKSLVDWMQSHHGIVIKYGHVHFFDDNVKNVPPFQGTGFNARQVSCKSRDEGGLIGVCGGLPEEIVDTPGVHTCG